MYPLDVKVVLVVEEGAAIPLEVRKCLDIGRNPLVLLPERIALRSERLVLLL